jgi:hypothetical protein
MQVKDGRPRRRDVEIHDDELRQFNIECLADGGWGVNVSGQFAAKEQS